MFQKMILTKHLGLSISRGNIQQIMIAIDSEIARKKKKYISIFVKIAPFTRLLRGDFVGALAATRKPSASERVVVICN